MPAQVAIWRPPAPRRLVVGVSQALAPRAGIIVLPCGAGKTLVGIVAASTVKRNILILCNSSVSVEQVPVWAIPSELSTHAIVATALSQWYQQLFMWAKIDAPARPGFESSGSPFKPGSSRVSRFTAGSKEDLPPPHQARWLPAPRLVHVRPFVTSHNSTRLHQAAVLISTYNMIGYTGKRSAKARAVMADISEREVHQRNGQSNTQPKSYLAS